MDVPPFFQEKVNFIEKLGFRYKPWLSSAAASLAGLGLLLFYSQTGLKAPAYAEIESVFVKWEASPQDELLFQKMRSALHKVPALEKKYEARIVQKLIETGRGAEAIEMAQHSLKEIEKEAPFHASFAETSLLIEQGSYQKALEMSVRLKEKMAKECDLECFSKEQLVGGAVLYAHNLLRIACLHQALKNKPGEMASWEELEAFLGKDEKTVVGQLIINNFQEKGLNLSDYISERKKQL